MAFPAAPTGAALTGGCKNFRRVANDQWQVAARQGLETIDVLWKIAQRIFLSPRLDTDSGEIEERTTR